MKWSDACIDQRPRPYWRIWGRRTGSAVKCESTAVAVVCFHRVIKKPHLVRHSHLATSGLGAAGLRGAVEKTILELRRRFWVRKVRYDPYQMQSMAERLLQARLPWLSSAQTTSNLTEASPDL